jgi:hypothetical protein
MPLLALLAVLFALVGAAGVVEAQQVAADLAASKPKPVVELFTSQGCSSCPAADALLARLATTDDLIALSLPVDYWDYLGWKDTLASPKFTERQRAYAQVRGDGAIYTPQVVVNGLAHVNGAEESQIKRALAKTEKAYAASFVPIHLSETDATLSIEVGAAPAGSAPKDANLWLAVIASRVEVPIRRGENEGKTIAYNNVVRELMPIGLWSGTALTVRLDRNTFMRPGTERCAVLLQQGRAGAILGAAFAKQC